jgi:hypothetical protein
MASEASSQNMQFYQMKLLPASQTWLVSCSRL